MSGWNLQKTSLQQVGGSLFRVMKVLCRQENTSWDGDPANVNIATTDAYRGEFKLKFPQSWDINSPTCCAVESVVIDGIPTWNNTAGKGGPQIPRSFSIRSDTLASNAVIEAKRWRGDIDNAGGVADASQPYSSTSTDWIDTEKSNVLQVIPNTFNLNWAYDAECTAGNLTATSASYYFYSVRFHQPVNLRTTGNQIPTTAAQTKMDLYITANYDFPQRSTTGTAFEPKLLTANTYDTLNGPAVASGVSGGGWDCLLVFYQLADSRTRK